ncbi:putative membrane bound O-acyl transferase (MBOAT) family protein; putative Alginate O-acetyltransferase [Bradyrhizobium sp. ORS 278]|uniref:MBOAT family O-acyltransferase n=1 Tax=Bradyrhizobium sp. (strain ORS 278) TaxID=114615 RepID=UPI0001508DCB|nr:MBOAT family O-acyltransferase [Bradyrhizobium sp. ORS 278]CAL79310.1 putative membrane bound O-acyl transferase (MBOAT) family protein; putative Alginate O-acetyltransferase [Bradyrhizobium sp. ORS 278]
MLFNGYPFLLVFLPVAIVLARLADPFPSLRMPVLAGLSLAFYGYGDPPFLLLLIASILGNWLAARLFARFKARGILTFAILANFVVLGLFKYADFAAANLGLLIGHHFPPLQLALPLGISFFTFHHIMYLADLRAGKAPLTSLDRYALYIAFFPQAIAGPLARWSEVMGQFGQRIYAPGWQQRFYLGIVFIVGGLIEKIMFGDRLGRLLDPIYAQAASGPLPAGEAWLAAFASVQILYDFAGYSDIAIGLGLLFGVRLPFNFDAPLRATNMQDFWQRWHMTLMAFLRDYVFRPMVNARLLPRRLFAVQYFAAMFITMILCGLWHGASWSFVLWGTLHGMAVVICALWRRFGPRLPAGLGWLLTFLVVLGTGVIFRAGSVEAAWHVFQGLASPPPFDRGVRLLPVVIPTLAALLLPASQDVAARLTRRPNVGLACLLGVAVLALLIELGERNVHEFIYFKF